MEPRCLLTTLSISSSPLLENAAGGFWLGRSGDVATALDVHVQLSSGTATEGSDFRALDETIHLDAQQAQAWVEVEHLDDGLVETVENYSISASTSSGLTATGQGSIADNDGSGYGSASASGSLWVTGGFYNENSAAGFWVGRSGDTSRALDVNVALSGDTATAGSDFTALSRSVHFNSGQSQVWVEVQHLDDTIAESAERYVISASTSDGEQPAEKGGSSTMTAVAREVAREVGQDQEAEREVGQDQAAAQALESLPRFRALAASCLAMF